MLNYLIKCYIQFAFTCKCLCDLFAHLEKKTQKHKLSRNNDKRIAFGFSLSISCLYSNSNRVQSLGEDVENTGVCSGVQSSSCPEKKTEKCHIQSLVWHNFCFCSWQLFLESFILLCQKKMVHSPYTCVLCKKIPFYC